MKRLLWCAVLLLILPLGACTQKEPALGKGKVQVVTTIFPLYDFARVVGGDRVEVVLLLPPGVEPHSFEPTPEDMVRISRAGLFVYTNPYMEPWVAGLLKGIDRQRLTVVDASAGVSYLPAAGEDNGHDVNEGGHHHGGMDPHVWLSIPNARKMVENIAAALGTKDPTNAAFYRQNAAVYEQKLTELDRKFQVGLGNCRTRRFLHGGHYAFGYLADHYGLQYVSAYAISADAEPRPRKLVEMIALMRSSGTRYIFYEELISPRVAETIARETGATLLRLNGVHNLSRDELQGGATYLSLMEQNLVNLRTGLQCR
ncbi:metal ABC transporter substrate-binding protein [Geomobilimonas luticola]|uniref:Metal ABC transporter substrate-binding protein n=1 Tax=Geomobilimonas luticola TaxID=1114878 RepID=A0ABS5SA29_9BACT|nr:metal ABC transporter substrate-binding protein [Geomobilimonas luticola]MBT0652222.1 metal ABC transporter substrate-binding protein [Geomobilimonas luticola]